MNCSAVGDCDRRAYRAISVTENIALIAAGALSILIVNGCTEWIEPHTPSAGKVEGIGTFLAAAVLVEGFAVRVGQANGTVSVVKLIPLVATGAFT